MRWSICFCCIVFFAISGVSSSVCGETLSFEDVLEQAVRHSWEVRIARKEIAISRSGLLEARSAYYPSLSLLFYNDYVFALGDGKSVVSVGDQVSANNLSTFQNSLVLGLSWLIYDFGARELRSANAQREVSLAELKAERTLLETRFKTLDSYARCLQLSRQLAMTGEMVMLRKEVFRVLRSLKEAGTVGQVRLDTAALDLAETLARQDQLEENLVRELADLGYLTGREYSRADTVFSDLPPAPMSKDLPEVTELPQVRLVDGEIDKARTQLKTQQREMLPNVSLSANYRMFGADTDRYTRSVGSLSERDATVALVFRWEFFNGFRDVARCGKVKHQIEQLELEKARVISDVKRQITTARQGAELSVPAEERLGERTTYLEQSAENLVRLENAQVLDRVTMLEQGIELLQQRMDVAVTTVQRRMAGWQLRFWSERRTP